MEIGISTASIFNRCMVEYTPPLLAALGAHVAEIFLNTYSEYEQPLVESVARSCRENGVRVYSVHPMSMQFEPQLFSIHERQKRDALLVYRRVLQACRTLGATHYVMHGAAILSGGAQNLHVERLAPRFTELCRMAEDCGVTLCLENVSWCFFHQPSFALELREAMGSRALKYCLDVKQSVRAGIDPVAFLDALGQDVRNVHLCDYQLTASGYVWRLPGEGECDFSAIAVALSRLGYEGCAFLEVYNNMYRDYDALAGAYRYLTSIFSREETA